MKFIENAELREELEELMAENIRLKNRIAELLGEPFGENYQALTEWIKQKIKEKHQAQ